MKFERNNFALLNINYRRRYLNMVSVLFVIMKRYQKGRREMELTYLEMDAFIGTTIMEIGVVMSIIFRIMVKGQ